MTTAWLCESVRVTALWPMPEPVGSDLTWEAVAGAPPELKEDHPRRGTHRERGPLDEERAILELQTAPGRVDWLLTAPLDAMVTEVVSSFPSIGSPKDALSLFEATVFNKAARAYSAPRFALGLVATRPATDLDAAHSELAKLLVSMKPKLSGAHDFLYQINRPRPSLSISGLGVNRLSRWSAVLATSVVLQTTGAASAARSVIAGTRVELDMNSAADRTQPIPEPSRVPLLKEFAQLALEILERGDIP
jgi:hypothetical protein